MPTVRTDYDQRIHALARRFQAADRLGLHDYNHHLTRAHGVVSAGIVDHSVACARIAAERGDPNPFKIAAEPTNGSEPLADWRSR